MKMFSGKIFFSIESYFEIYQKSLHRQRVTVLCALWQRGVTDRYFFQNKMINFHT